MWLLVHVKVTTTTNFMFYKKSLPSFVILFTYPYPVISISDQWLIHGKTIVAYFMIFFFKFKFYQLLIDFETKLVYIINCFPASTPTKTSVTFICSPPPSPIGFNNWDYHWYCVEEMWLVGGNPRGAPGHPSLHNRKQQWFQLNVIFFYWFF